MCLFHSTSQLKGQLAQAVELKFHVHLYHKVATALAPSLRSFLRKTVTALEYEEVVNTLAELIHNLAMKSRGAVAIDT